MLTDRAEKMEPTIDTLRYLKDAFRAKSYIAGSEYKSIYFGYAWFSAFRTLVKSQKAPFYNWLRKPLLSGQAASHEVEFPFRAKFPNLDRFNWLIALTSRNNSLNPINMLIAT
ncbi:MAG: hypothetical protein B6D39_07210 [Anaerolineae bacterium UTCFX2]|jgi:hypothetical protein|nr:MAG: hypothetical protein B6D39_07210 [Anaerolineae bacterium UTCFX2]